MRMFKPKQDLEAVPGQIAQAVTILPEPVTPKPRPAHPGTAIDPEWRATAQAVGYAPSYLAANDFLVALARLDIPVYDYQDVRQYLDATCARLNAGHGAPNSFGAMMMTMWSWRWEPLRECDAVKLQVHPSVCYAHPVPLHALRLVEKIVPHFSQAIFSVSNIYQRPQGDPFLAVQPMAGMNYHVIDQWDEPSFTGRAQ